MTRRAGFEREGVLRAWDLLRGDPIDCVVYSRLRDDRTVAVAPAGRSRLPADDGLI